ncbi:phosphatase 2C family protein [Penicillium capsulatum]|uniref:protein-serine/threonine phosphatase n=1 Tax=Penicillium capsulatum TaxID=69766 RepID=A0A9W9LRC7_9EURO|nr:phosphatase 2C family protein [Penicillium capsulatum]KAJ6136250.1 phosphatase 2C family protein [Penicillium capsulatum]
MADPKEIPLATVVLEDAGSCSKQGSRPTQQDRSMMLLPDKFPKRGPNERALFMLCDGHGSARASKHAVSNIPQLILRHPTLAEGNYEDIVQSAICDEEALLYDLYRRGDNGLAFAGTTVAVCLLDLTRGLLTVGNLGDSMVFLGEVDTNEPNKMHVNRISRLHKPASPREKNRIEVAGGTVDMDGDTPRIGGLNMSRALGDLHQKNPPANSGEEPGDYFSKGNILSSDPTMSQIQLRDDRRYLLVITSDGVTDMVSDEQLLSAITTLYQSGRSATQVSEMITTAVSSHDRSDNATCIVAFFKGRKVKHDRDIPVGKNEPSEQEPTSTTE